MVTKTKIGAKQVPTAKELAATYKESAQQIWQAGLGAFSKAQEQGGKVFEALVKEGQALQQKTQSVAQERFSDVTAKVTAKANAMRDEMLAKTNGQWGKLEGLFEERVAKALKTMGLPTQKDIAELHKRIDALAAGKAAPAKAPAAKAPVAKAPATKASPAAKKAVTAPQKAPAAKKVARGSAK